MARLCKDRKQTDKDAKKAAARREDGKAYFVCGKCARASHNADHLCKPEKKK